MNRFSKIAFGACCVFIFLTGFFYYPKWKQQATEATLSWDVSGYYLYLPATFIYKDLKQCRFFDSVLQKYHPTPDFQQAIHQESGNCVMKYTMGQAILFAPYFFAAHGYALLTAYPADGFSSPYQVCIGLGMLLYSFIGLWFLRKILLRYFHDRVVAITLLIVAFATNYLNYSAIDGGMTHNTLFMLYALFMYRVIRFYEQPTKRTAVAIGLLAGLLVLVRPTEIICILIPLLWNVSGFTDLKQKISRTIVGINTWIMGAIAFVLLVSLQLIYWKWSSGRWVFDGYRNEGFDWLRPHIGPGLFSYKGGWFTYTPAMLFVLPGFIVLYVRFKKIFFAVFLFSLFFLYVCFSWKEWWYGASLGQRAIIQAYPLFCFPIAAFFDWLGQRRLLVFITTLFISFCIFYNLWLTHQAHRGHLFQGGSMTGAYLWRIAGRFDVPKETQLLLDNEEQVPASMLKDSVAIQTDPTAAAAILDSVHPYSPGYSLMIPKNIEWVRVNVLVSTPVKEWDVWKMPQATILFYNGDEVIKTNYIRISRILSDGETGVVFVDAKVPPQYNKAKLSLWNGDSQKVLTIHKISVLGFAGK